MDYQFSQLLGSAMRNSQVEAFIFDSARCLSLGKNIAAFSPEVFEKKKNDYIFNQQTWSCLTNKRLVEFTQLSTNKNMRLVFKEEMFI